MSRSFKASALICLLLVAVVGVAPVVNAVSWTVLNPADYISSTSRENGIDYVSYNFNTSPLINYSLRGFSGDELTGSATGSVSLDIDHAYGLPARFHVYPLGKKYNPGYGLTTVYSGQIAIDARDFKPNAALTTNVNIYLHVDYVYDTAVEATRSDVLGLGITVAFYEYDSNGAYIDNISETFEYKYALSPQTDTATFQVPFQKTLTLSSMHGDTRYIIPYFYVGMGLPQDVDDIELRRIEFSSEAFYIQTQTDMLLKDSLTLEAINDKLDYTNDSLDGINDKLTDTNDKLDDTNDKLDEIIQQPEQEKQEASSEGQELVDQLTGALPNESQGFMDAIRKLADSMSYEGVEAKLTFPAITLPEIPGVMKSYKLNEELPIDFGFWVQKIPGPILTLVQVVLTLGLVVFAFKELYGLISYAMTLKSGGAE